ncbi:MAG: hypothetical protein CFH08_02614 [Alphaproteobacteria bacterium MarineAlpha3_Bin7]|nr:MAG: hypothetical protein CFH08_02614 [Alphaproteobacteria bacterium MarineAlpha3_Bin7]
MSALDKFSYLMISYKNLGDKIGGRVNVVNP